MSYLTVTNAECLNDDFVPEQSVLLADDTQYYLFALFFRISIGRSTITNKQDHLF